MPIPLTTVIDEFGAASERGSAVLFVGAGLSQGAGLPGWMELIDAPRRRAGVPQLDDAPLLAQYIADSDVVDRSELDTHVLREITKVPPTSLTPVHRLLAKLRVSEIWTTNYDQFLETACTDAVTIFNEESAHRAGSRGTTIIKMHGSARFGDPPSWDALPVLTRGDYERYEDAHRRIWTMLQAVFLSRTILFVGFSFTDPNIELLQKLARRYGMASGNKHLAILRPPGEHDDLARYKLQRHDLENSGVRVGEIAEHADLETLFASLAVRTRPRRLFIGGSNTGAEGYAALCAQMAGKIDAEPSWQVDSLGGDAGWLTSKQLAMLQAALGIYDANRIRFHFRKSDSPPPPMDSRIGTAIYSSLDRDALVPLVLEGCRAMLVIGGGSRTAQEIAWANEQGMGVVPLAASGGAAEYYFRSASADPPRLGGSAVDRRTWENLASTNSGVACSAAMGLLRQAMYSST